MCGSDVGAVHGDAGRGQDGDVILPPGVSGDSAQNGKGMGYTVWQACCRTVLSVRTIRYGLHQKRLHQDRLQTIECLTVCCMGRAAAGGFCKWR